ncbi:Leucine-responsive regulatory protein [compost metagenome]|uniref:Lrp/AsnC family transcriptional regulator n=1 Tax=Cupriavidus campinensis TaxID=151783 RepID=A0AAE9I354_9BURK|nr:MULTISPECIES: Lrp/AsnC family transcriptional regulator [Cupriavidus]TSP13795.1 Lrp/AsnC family transcriptional regulator [Cupriavidus campinensis]URF06557.1 Lrp/AsnC family transcriptional regulator [Cupriavidus campinensis]CAG2135304.1 Leucine-responsive regulatory protein [Cupriavidus campinensis]
MQNTELDRTDRRLLGVLQENGRASNLELAEAISLSPAQTLRRHRRLEESGIIKRYEARLDSTALGFGVTAFIHVTMERGHIRDLSKFKGLVAELAQIQECFSVTGDIDYVLKVVAKDLKSLSDFLLDTLMRIPGVSGVKSSVCLDEIKCTSAMPLEA